MSTKRVRICKGEQITLEILHEKGGPVWRNPPIGPIFTATMTINSSSSTLPEADIHVLWPKTPTDIAERKNPLINCNSITFITCDWSLYALIDGNHRFHKFVLFPDEIENASWDVFC